MITPNEAKKIALQILEDETRAASFTEKARAARAGLAQAMAEAGKSQFKAGGIVISTMHTPTRLTVAEVETLPEKYRRMAWVAENDLIKAAIKRGDAVPGAVLSPSRLTIRIKAT